MVYFKCETFAITFLGFLSKEDCFPLFPFSKLYSNSLPLCRNPHKEQSFSTLQILGHSLDRSPPRPFPRGNTSRCLSQLITTPPLISCLLESRHKSFSQNKLYYKETQIESFMCAPSVKDPAEQFVLSVLAKSNEVLVAAFFLFCFVLLSLPP